MDEQMTAGERAAYARGVDDGARRTRETIAASLAKHAAGWRDRPPSDAAAIVATTLEGLAEALGGTAQTGPAPADALAQDGAEDEMVSDVKGRVFAGLLAQLCEDDLERMRRGA